MQALINIDNPPSGPGALYGSPCRALCSLMLGRALAARSAQRIHEGKAEQTLQRLLSPKNRVLLGWHANGRWGTNARAIIDRARQPIIADAAAATIKVGKVLGF